MPVQRTLPFVLVVLGAFAALGPAFVVPAVGRGTRDDDAETAAYLKATPEDLVARLQQRLDSGAVRLKYDGERGYLPAVLNALHISPDTQTLVFSRTSFQRTLISPRSPRALYFNDDCYVGYVQGGDVLEFSAVDPRWGAIFYTLSQFPSGHPKFVWQTYDCLQCHQSSMTGNLPGHIVRSVVPLPDGTPDFSAGNRLTTDASPLSERWGGWYVSGTHGTRQRHQGNVVARDGEKTLDLDAGANHLDLSKWVNTDPYLTAHSDIVALLFLDHQTDLHNRIARAHNLTLAALREAQVMNELEGKAPDAPRETRPIRLRAACEPLVRGLLFAGAAPLTEPVRGTSGFAGRFGSLGPQDHKGRSLRQLDLQTRLLRYPCSYLIYSEAFTRLPAPAKSYVFHRLGEILSGTDHSPDYAHLSVADRQAISEILSDTLPEYRAALSSNR